MQNLQEHLINITHQFWLKTQQREMYVFRSLDRNEVLSKCIKNVMTPIYILATQKTSKWFFMKYSRHYSKFAAVLDYEAFFFYTM